jgi:streptogramin lyase
VSITPFPVPTAGSIPTDLAAGPDGNLWFTEEFASQIGRITPAGTVSEFALPGDDKGPLLMTAGPDGNLWFTEIGELGATTGAQSYIGRMTIAGAFMEFKVPSLGRAEGITAGSDGNLWFTEFDANKIGRITPVGTITEFPVPTPGGGPLGIAAGPDGNVWFTEFGTPSPASRIGRITPTGTITEFTLPTPGSQPNGIVTGPDGNLWFTEQTGNKIGRITPAGTITEFPVPTAGSGPFRITAGADGNLWFDETFANKYGRITPTGTVTEFPVPSPIKDPEGIAPGPDGNVWLALGEVNGQIGRIQAAVSGVSNILAMDSGFVPQTRSVPVRGMTVKWSFVGAQTGAVIDTSGMSLFASGTKPIGSSYSFTFSGAGTYRYSDPVHASHVAAITVPLSATPANGTATTKFKLTWASAPPPAGFVFDVQESGPPGEAFHNLFTGQTGTMATFVANEGIGPYYFRARLRKISNGKASGWSPPAAITVS